MLNKIKKKLANQKGMSTIEFAISLMVFIMLFSYIFDLCLITYKQYAVAEQATQMARQIAKQSGVERTTPFNFPGGAENYYTVSELYSIMERKMGNLNIPNSDWTVKVSTVDKSQPSQMQNKNLILVKNPGANTPNLRTNYRDPISVEVTYNYTWGLWSQFIPGIAKGTTVVERSSFSEYNHNLNN